MNAVVTGGTKGIGFSIARAILAAGAKLYVNRRTFVRTDARYGAGPRGQHLAFRIGVGWDF